MNVPIYVRRPSKAQDNYQLVLAEERCSKHKSAAFLTSWEIDALLQIE